MRIIGSLVVRNEEDRYLGRRLLWDGSTVNKHVMHPDLLEIGRAHV